MSERIEWNQINIIRVKWADWWTEIKWNLIEWIKQRSGLAHQRAAPFNLISSTLFISPKEMKCWMKLMIELEKEWRSKHKTNSQFLLNKREEMEFVCFCGAAGGHLFFLIWFHGVEWNQNKRRMSVCWISETNSEWR